MIPSEIFGDFDRWEGEISAHSISLSQPWRNRSEKGQ